jgi:DNA-binding GntR family transcriptional regulator
MPLTLDRTSDSDARLSEAVYQSLPEAILYGSLLPGEVVSELALAKTLCVSRTPVHDTVRQLIKDGLVRQERNRQAVVAAFTADDIRDVFEMRAVLEAEAAALAAPRIDRAARQELRAAIDHLDRDWGADGWVGRWADHDQEFHAAVARACGNRRLGQEVMKYRTLHRGLNKTHTAADLLHHALAEHRRVLDALDARDPAAARAAMAAHIREWQTYFVNRRLEDG